MTPNMRLFLNVLAIALAAAAMLVASQPAESHSLCPCAASNRSLAMSMRTRVAAHAFNCSSVNFVMASVGQPANL